MPLTEQYDARDPKQLVLILRALEQQIAETHRPAATAASEARGLRAEMQRFQAMVAGQVERQRQELETFRAELATIASRYPAADSAERIERIEQYIARGGSELEARLRGTEGLVQRVNELGEIVLDGNPRMGQVPLVFRVISLEKSAESGRWIVSAGALIVITVFVVVLALFLRGWFG